MFAGETIPMSETAPPANLMGNYCVDCGAPISPHSRGRCIPCGHRGMKRDVPDDFADILRSLGSRGAARHYKTSLSTLTRWRRECGMHKHQRAKPTIMAARRTGFAERPLMQNRDMSFAGQAADYLKRFGSLHRCNSDGSFNPKGDCWRRNNRVVTSDRLIKIAVSLGFRYESPVDEDVPEGFVSVAEAGVRTAAAFFGRSYRTTASLKRRLCPSPQGAPRKPVPSDIDKIANRLSLRAMADHYQVNRRTVLRWLREEGISISNRKHLGKRLNS